VKTKQLNSGDCIPIIEDTVFFHACCKCGKYHEVHVEKVDGMLVTRWFAIDKLPTIEELEQRGEIVDVLDYTATGKEEAEG
jgi:hypothetical protein